MTADATADGSGNWSISPTNLTSLADGTVTISATATDAAGNHATQTRTILKDTTTSVSISAPVADSTVNASQEVAVSVSGTAGANDTIVVTFTDSAAPTPHTVTTDATADGSGNWSISATNLVTLADGTVTILATATDATGGTNTASTTILKETRTSVSISTPVAGSTVNALQENAVTVSGTAGANDTIVVTFTDTTTPTPSTVTADATANGSGAWSISPTDLTSLADGTVTISATATDAAGNHATRVRTILKDTAAPAVTVDPLVTSSDTPTQTGTVSDPSPSSGIATVFVTVDGQDLTAIVNGDTWSVAVATLTVGTYDVTVTATDNAGNSVSTTVDDALTVTT